MEFRGMSRSNPCMSMLIYWATSWRLGWKIYLVTVSRYDWSGDGDKDWPGKQSGLCSTHWPNTLLYSTFTSGSGILTFLHSEEWIFHVVLSENVWNICEIYTTLLDTPVAVFEPSKNVPNWRVARLHWYVFNSRCLTLCARPSLLFPTFLWACDSSWWLWDYAVL